MCIAPTRLPDGNEVACRYCWQCRSNRVNDFVGRSIAESKIALATHVVTLTYGRDGEGKPDHERANYLTYSDVQKWFKRLRVEGHSLRYLVAGEYGSEKGRAHWHAVIFWHTKPPKVKLLVRELQAFWDHGWSYWEIPESPAAFKYVCKYVLKDQRDDENQSRFQMSKTPPIGTPFFTMLAKRYVQQGLSPQDLFYRFPEAKKRNGAPIDFKMSGRAADYFIEAYIAEFIRVHGHDRWPNSDMVEEYLDKQVPPEMDLQRRHYPDYVHRPKKQNLLSYMLMENVAFAERLNVWKHTDPKTGYVLYWAKNPKGEYQWQGVIGRGGSRLPPPIR